MRGTVVRHAMLGMALLSLVTACDDRTQPAELEKIDSAPLAATAGPVAALQVVSGDGQIGLVGEYLANPIVVRVLDATGAPVAGKGVSWRVTAGAGSIFASNGMISDADGYVRATWRMGTAAGPNSVEAYHYIAGGTVAIPITATAVSGGAVKSWVGGISRDFADQRNWSPEGVPNSKDTVRIATAERTPLLVGNGSIGRLEVANGGTLEVTAGKLAVAGEALVDGAVTGTGTVLLNGIGGNLRGRFPNLEIARGPGRLAPVAVLIDTLWVDGDLTVNGTFDPTGQWAFVRGNLISSSGDSRLRMINGGAVVVDGNASFLAGGGNNLLTNGMLWLKGNFTSKGIHSFIGGEGFHTRLLGSTQQVIEFQYGSMNASRFGHLRIENPAGVKFIKNAAVYGMVSAMAGGPIIGADTLTVRLDFMNNGPTKLGGLSSGWGISADSATYDVGTSILTPFSTTGFFVQMGLPFKNLIVKASNNASLVRLLTPLTLEGNLEVPWGKLLTSADGRTTVKGNLVVGNAGELTLGDDLDVENNATVQGSIAKLYLNGQELEVFGDMSVSASRGVQMLNANDHLKVHRNFTITHDQRGAYKAGTLRVRKNFTATGHYAFVGDPGHKVVLDGTQDQTVTFSDTLGYSYFHRLEIDNPISGVRFASPKVKVRGDLKLLGKITVPTATTLDITGYTARNNYGVYTFHPSKLYFGHTHSIFNDGLIRTNGFESIDLQTPIKVTGALPIVVGCQGSGCPQ
jgi:hypothetical protein